MSKLLPCPFCGGEAKMKFIAAVLHTVACEKCKASCDVLRTKADTIASWNTRHTPQASKTQKAAADVLAAQEAKGVVNHGKTLDTATLTALELAINAQEEAADQLMYLTAMVELMKKEAKP